MRDLSKLDADALESWRQQKTTRVLMDAAKGRRDEVLSELCRHAASAPKRVIRILAGRLEEADWLIKTLGTKGVGHDEENTEETGRNTR